MFYGDAARGQSAIVLFLFGCEWVMLTLSLFVRSLAIAMKFVESLIAGVGQQFKAWRQRQATLFEQGKVMDFAGANIDTQDLLRTLVNHDLSFLSVHGLSAYIT